MLAFSELVIYLVKYLYKFLKNTGLLLPVLMAGLIICFQEGVLGLVLFDSSVAIYLDFLLMYISLVIFLVIFINNSIKKFKKLKLDVKYIKNYINEKHYKDIK